MAAKRTTKTEEKIRCALTELLPQKGLAGMTVSDVCRVAGINRGTFYAHYTDKFDLMDKQIQRLADTLTQIVLGMGEADGKTAAVTPEHKTPGASDETYELFAKERVVACLTYVYENYAFIAALTANGSDARLKDFVKELIGELFEKSAAARGLELRIERDDYGREMLFSGITSVFWLWLQKGCPETPEEITKIVWTHKSLSPEELASI